GVLLPVGTRKGLFLARSEDGASWQVEGPLLPGWSVYHAIVDARDGALHAATNNPFYGATTHRSDDSGKTWERAEELGLPEDADQQQRGGRVHAGSVSGGRPVRAQAARAPEEAGAPLAAEPLRRVPLRRPRRHLGAARRQRAADELRVPARTRSRRSRRRIRD